MFHDAAIPNEGNGRRVALSDLEFPLLVANPDLAYLDNASTVQKPQCVLDAIGCFYRSHYANVHRGVHGLSQRATEYFEHARTKLAEFIHAPARDEVVFLRGTTEAINLVAQAYARPRLKPGDHVLVTQMEHHANLVPWQLVCAQTGAQLVPVPMTVNGDLDLETLNHLLDDRARILALTHVSNAIGTINPLRPIIQMAHAVGAVVVVDGAQAVPHLGVDVRALDCDFYAFSGHKMYGPTGIGVLYAKGSLLEGMEPYHGGGSMIQSVTMQSSTYREIPYRFEAGTPAIAEAVGLGAAVDFLNRLGMERVRGIEHELLQLAIDGLRGIPGVRLLGQPLNQTAVLSFNLDGIHAHDVGTILDSVNVAVRAGHHCAQPTLEFFRVPATVRASFAVYNTPQDVRALVQGLEQVKEVFS